MTGEPGQFGPTWRNIYKGLGDGVAVALIGLAPLGLARLARWAVAGVARLRVGRREAMNTAPQGWRGGRLNHYGL